MIEVLTDDVLFSGAARPGGGAGGKAATGRKASGGGGGRGGRAGGAAKKVSAVQRGRNMRNKARESMSAAQKRADSTAYKAGTGKYAKWKKVRGGDRVPPARKAAAAAAAPAKAAKAKKAPAKTAKKSIGKRNR